MKNLRVPFRVVFYKDGSGWVAHCLEFDLMGDGPSKPEALARLVEAISLQVEASLKYDNPRNLFKPADGKFFAMHAAGRDAGAGELRLDFDSVSIETTQTREYLDSSLDNDPTLARV